MLWLLCSVQRQSRQYWKCAHVAVLHLVAVMPVLEECSCCCASSSGSHASTRRVLKLNTPSQKSSRSGHLLKLQN